MNRIYLKFLKFRLKYFPMFAKKYDFNKILDGCGISVGEGTIFYDPNSMAIDRERPWMLKIGKYCKITKGTIILTHDYSRSVLRRAYGEIIGEAGNTEIGDNVFIGMNSIILMGSHIGNNVIIGAGSVVSGNIPDNCVAAGNPCRVIRTLDEHYLLRKERSIKEAKIYYKSYVKAYNRKPLEKEMAAFFPLWLERSEQAITKSKVSFLMNGDNPEEAKEFFMGTKPVYKNWKNFCAEMENDGEYNENEF